MIKRITIAATLVIVALTITACKPGDALDAMPIDSAAELVLDRFKSGGGKAHAIALQVLDGYCQMPERARLALRDRYDGKVVIACE